MDPGAAPISQREAMAWSDEQSMSSDEDCGGMATPLSQSPRENVYADASLRAQIRAGQISPVSSGMDVMMETSSAPTMINSASSSCADSWSIGFVDGDDNENENDVTWEQDSDDVLAIPKLEPVDDDIDLDDVKAAPLSPAAPSDPSGAQVKQKRPRGRPRKHPRTPIVSSSKITKGRSKTGCITCRKRKKKCDEAKPRCMNCEKNAVVCEGYHEKQLWKSGRERAEEERMRYDSVPCITMQPIFHGVETAEDRVFWKHYINHFSNVLTVEGESKNAFKDILLHLANKHQGLMHSILAVSSKHLDLEDPHGAVILQENPGTTHESLQERASYHHDAAMKRLYEDMSMTMDKDDPEYETILSACYGQMLCLLLQTLAEGNPRGEHRVHLNAYKTLIQQSPPNDLAFHTFITEFFQYHIYADDLLWHPGTNATRLSAEDWEAPVLIHPPRLLGVADGLLKYLSQITTIRNTIRANMAASDDLLVDYTIFYRAAEIDTAIREWTPNWPAGDSRNRVALLYKQMVWVYLFRTIYPPSAHPPSPVRRSTLSSLPATLDPSAADMQRRRASLAGSVGSAESAPVVGATSVFTGVRLPRSCPSSRNPSRTSSMHELDSRAAPAQASQGGRPSSPPPIRRPAHHDHRITLAVEESLTILESFKPSEPAQTLLLIPCIVIGTACFDASQQDRIRAAVKAVRGYTGLRNCDRVSEVLEEVWALMDQGEWLAVWDWQGVARRMKLDFLCT